LRRRPRPLFAGLFPPRPGRRHRRTGRNRRPCFSKARGGVFSPWERIGAGVSPGLQIQWAGLTPSPVGSTPTRSRQGISRDSPLGREGAGGGEASPAPPFDYPPSRGVHFSGSLGRNLLHWGAAESAPAEAALPKILDLK